MNINQKQKIGAIGENIAVKHLVKQKYEILDRNFRKPWGEIDIVAKKDNVIHFVEVKSVSCVTNVLKKMNLSEDYMPEDNVHLWKIKRLVRAAQSYLGHIKAHEDQEWQIDMMAVFLDLENKKARMRLTEDIGL